MPVLSGAFLPGLISVLREAGDVEDVLQALCEALQADGLDVWRASLGLEFLHPEVSGALTIWLDGQIVRRETDRAGILASSDYLNSPTRIVDETHRPLIMTLDRPMTHLPLLESLRQQGATSYAMFPLAFLERSRSANVSFSTRSTGGFSADDIEALGFVADVISPYAERLVLRRIASDLLDTYVGPRTGEKILAGDIERGSVETIEAAIWFADLRGFTTMSETLPLNDVLAVLDRWFNAMNGAISAQGGEILKFMGDGALAIFPVSPSGGKGDACRRAYAAAVEFTDALQTESPDWAFGIGLHVGQVAYGNIGASRRLDFTVIGPAVNMASRLEKVSKPLGCRMVASPEFAAHCGAPMHDGGRHRLAGLTGHHQVYVRI